MAIGKNTSAIRIAKIIQVINPNASPKIKLIKATIKKTKKGNSNIFFIFVFLNIYFIISEKLKLGNRRLEKRL